MRRLIAVTLLMVAGLVPAAASCGPTTPAPDPVITSASLPPSEAVQAVRSATEMLATTPVHFELTVNREVALEGNADPAADVAELTARGPAPSSRRVGGDLYLRTPGSTGWVHLEIARMTAGSVNLAQLRLATQMLILHGLSAAVETSPGRFDCRSDLDRAAAEASAADVPVAKALVFSAHLPGDAALPFQVTVDGQRRMTSVFYVLGTAGAAMSYTLTFSKHGQPVSIQRPPAAEVTEASPAQYGSL
jgi:hypothetical protein